MKTESPWHGLSSGGLDARRVDRAGHWDYFWWVAERGEPSLIMRLPVGTKELQPLPKMRSLDLRYRDTSAGRALLIMLRDEEQAELFATLCRDIVLAGESGQSQDDALARTIRRTLRWHHLLRRGAAGILSLEEQRGLVGELHFLIKICDLIGPRAAIEAWKGPAGSSKDFELDGCLIEIKARRGAAKPFVQISSEDQLSDISGCRLFLTVYDVDAAVKPAGLTLTDHVRLAEKRFQDADMTAYALWEAALDAAGFSFEDDYADLRWTMGKKQEFEVVDGFPRISLPLANGVGSVRYSIALDACQPFLAPENTLSMLIGQVNQNG